MKVTQRLLIAAAAAFAAAAGVSRFDPRSDFLTWAMVLTGCVLVGAALASLVHDHHDDEKEKP